MAVITAALGVSLATASPAAATNPGIWRDYGSTTPVGSNSGTWRCGPTVEIATEVFAQTCAVRSPDLVDVQAAVIVRNNQSAPFATTAAVSMYLANGNIMGNWGCPLWSVGAHSWSACFGPTLHTSASVKSGGAANGYDIWLSPPA